MTGPELKELRKQLGLSLNEAANQVHVSVRTWCRYEADEYKIPEGVVHLFCIQNNLKYSDSTRRVL